MDNPLIVIGVSFVASGVYVFLRALQQLNVVHGYYWRIFPVSIGMGIGDVTLVLLMVKANTIWIGISNGVAAALGCYAAMYLTRRLRG